MSQEDEKPISLDHHLTDDDLVEESTDNPETEPGTDSETDNDTLKVSIGDKIGDLAEENLAKVIGPDAAKALIRLSDTEREIAEEIDFFDGALNVSVPPKIAKYGFMAWILASKGFVAYQIVQAMKEQAKAEEIQRSVVAESGSEGMPTHAS